MIIDTHVHYNLEPLFSNNNWSKISEEEKKQGKLELLKGHDILSMNQDEWLYPNQSWLLHWQKAQEANILKSIIVGTDESSNNLALIISQKQENLFAAVGMHPTHITQKIEDWVKEKYSLEEIESWLIDQEEFPYLLTKKRVVAVGEVGLDYFHLPENKELVPLVKKLQKKAFSLYIEASQKNNLPLIIHVRDKEMPEEVTEGNAYWDALKILQKHDVKQFTLHCVSGPLSYVKAAVEIGGYMGFDGNITYPNAQHIRDIFSIVPEDRRLVETDAPFLPPQEFRGKICEPWMLSKTVEYIERELKVDKNTFAQNAERLFKLK